MPWAAWPARGPAGDAGKGGCGLGPNSKKMTRKQYVNYRLRVLRELYIPPPSAERIQEMLDEERMTEADVDRVFFSCIQKARRR